MIKMCLIGAGRAGMVNARNFEFNIPDTTYTAVVDPDREAAEKSAEELGASSYSSFERALEKEEFEAVSIGAPTFVHAEAVMKAANAGKDIFCEKPLAITLKEAEAMEKAIKENGVKFQLGFMRRFDSNYLKAKKLIENGEIGEPILIKSVGRGPGLPPEWYADINKSNGLLAEVNSHDFDSMRWLMGSDFREVYATADNFKCSQYEDKYPDFYDTAAVNLKFNNGKLGMVDGCCPATYGYDARTEILGKEGMLQIGTKKSSSVLIWDKKGHLNQKGVDSWRNLFKEAYLEETRHFVSCIKEDKKPKVGIKAGKKAIEVVVAANKSIKENKPVSIKN
ncbi:MAG: Gfo/Idh/MocA family oxidoreductase [Halanaerobiales bacterium]